jgi:hypothetical protein
MAIVWPPFDPGEIIPDNVINWAPRLNGKAITSSAWSASSPAGLTISNPTFTPNSTRITLSGGVAGTLYQLTNTVTIVNAADVEIEVVEILCEKRAFLD